MESRLDILLDLLHCSADGALASHSLAMPGYPFATAVTFAPDLDHRPVFLLSTLAEHTQNLAADARASLLLRTSLADGEMARVTLAGNVARFDADVALVERYLRYQPEARRLLEFGDFGFYRLNPLRIRVIGGFAQAGWLDGQRLPVSPTLSLGDEAALVAQLCPPGGVVVLGVDACGLDVAVGGSRRRWPLAGTDTRALQVAAQARLDALAAGD